MKLDQLPKITNSRKKRVGRGYGSGKGGHTSGRGAKGTKARNKVPLSFTGTKFKKSFLKRLPLQRGKGKFKSLKTGPVLVSLAYLDLLPEKDVVDLPLLVKHRIVKENDAVRFGVKVLGNGEISKSLKVNLPCSRGASQKIKKAGGDVIYQEEKSGQSEKKKALKTENRSAKARPAKNKRNKKPAKK